MLGLEAFTDEYFPEVVVDRDEEKLVIKDYLCKVLKGRKKALYIYGSCGIGKTTVVKHVLNQFEDAYENAEVIYVNCEEATPNKVLKEIHDLVHGRESGKRIPSSWLIHEIKNKKIREKNFTLVIALDNFDRMAHVADLLWKLHSISPKFPRFGLILISTSSLNKRLMGGRLFSRLNPEFYEFKPYNAERLYEILKYRVKEAYGRKIIEDNSIRRLAEFVAENNGNVRKLFSLFLDAFDLSQKAGIKRITLKAINEVIRVKSWDN